MVKYEDFLSYISNTEVGRTTLDLFTLCMICDALVVPINWVIYGGGKIR